MEALATVRADVRAFFVMRLYMAAKVISALVRPVAGLASVCLAALSAVD